MQIPRSTLVRITKVCSAACTVLNPRRELGDENDLICHLLTKLTDADVCTAKLTGRQRKHRTHFVTPRPPSTVQGSAGGLPSLPLAALV